MKLFLFRLCFVAAAFTAAASERSRTNAESPGAAAELSEERLELLNGATQSNRLWRLEQSSQPAKFRLALETARKLRADKDLKRAETAFIQILESAAPEEIKRPALLQLAMVMQEQKEWQKAQRLYSEYIRRYDKDAAVPEVLLRQAYLYRDMGVPALALAKFYGVISTCLSLKLETMEYYQKLVLRAQAEIADTYYLQGKHPEAIDYFNRLLRLEITENERADFLYKLVHSCAALGKFDEAAANARLYLEKFPDFVDAPETRFLLADCLKKLGRKKEALEQIGLLLSKQHERSKTDPAQWLYWQQRAGNEIANQLYREGDFLSALQVYQTLADLNAAPEWQIPVWYQIGLVFENLKQESKASEMYDKIIARGKEGGQGTASVKTIVEMALWRKNFIAWEATAKLANQQLQAPAPKDGAL